MTAYTYYQYYDHQNFDEQTVFEQNFEEAENQNVFQSVLDRAPWKNLKQR